VITRRDLTSGQQATQAVHAALDFSVAFPELTKEWHDQSNYLVVLAAANQEELLDLASRAWDAGLRYTVFTEPDLPEGDQITAIVIEPGEATSKLCANLPLALREEAMV